MKSFRIPDGTAIHEYFLHLLPKHRAFQLVFGGDPYRVQKNMVLMELAKFCRAYAPCRDKREEGRREVWLHIQKFLKLTDEELSVMLSTLTHEQRYQLFKPSATFTE